jgi:hypothetical protein
MSETTVDSPVQEAPTVPVESKKASPAQELRDIQALLVSGVFAGNMAPAVCKAFNLLEQMAQAVEKNEEQKPS